jgi:hypothetical protein
VLHRWLKEHERNGCHQLVAVSSSVIAARPLERNVRRLLHD